MSGCQEPDHERFRGVFFARNGCLACELESMSEQNKELKELARAQEKLCAAYRLKRSPTGSVFKTIARLKHLINE